MEDIRYKLLTEMSKSQKLNSKFNLNTQYSKDDIEELISEKLIIKVGKSDAMPFYKISMKGYLHLIEYNHLLNSYWIQKWQRILFFPLIILSVSLSVLSLTKSCKDEVDKEEYKAKQSVKKELEYQ